MRTLAAAALLLAGAATATANTVQTNVCGVNWYYCPRDPGCVTYTMSVHEVTVHANDYKGTVKMDELKIGDSITIELSGITTMKVVPVQGSYRIYGLDGKNVATGILTGGVLTLNGDKFDMKVTFTLDHDNFDSSKHWTEWTLDVFQKGSGSDEGMCVEFADVEYLHYEENKPDPPFVDYCVDNGNGTFSQQTIAIKGNAISSPACGASKCDLKWNYCPRDPGCSTYTMEVHSVEVDVEDKVALKSGDSVSVTVTGNTTLKTVPTQGSYRIYSLAGVNVAAGTLSSALTVDNGNFVLKASFQVPDTCFDTAKNWFEFGIDVFQKGSGSDEGMCIEVANPTYVAYEQATLSPPFVTSCEMTSFPFRPVAGGVPEIVHDAVCKLL